MTEQHSESSCLKFVTVGKDGKRRFDRRAKQWLVEACLEPGASVAGLALRHGVNANLLRKWIKLHQQRMTRGCYELCR
ncbi:transposase [Burkholderia ubonensis]|uniref:transposase n=1 Tax=Burkholderia ubonensis TaxID=101571 RepID=UPI000B20EB89